MTLKQKAAADAVAMTSSDGFGETGTLYVESGGSRTIQFTVRRLGKVPSEDGDFVFEKAEVFIPNDAAVGVTVIAEGDELDLVLEHGQASQRCRITEVLESGPEGFVVEVQP